MWPSSSSGYSSYTPSSLPSRYRPTGSLQSSASSSSSTFNYTPSSTSSSYGSSRLGSSGIGASRYSSSTLTSNPSYLPTTTRDTSTYQSTGQYNINQSPYATSSTTSTQPELYSAYSNTQPTAYSSRLSPAPLSSRLSPNRLSPGPSTSGFSTQKSYREASPPTQTPTNPKSKFFSRRNSAADLINDRRPSIVVDPNQNAINKRSDSLTDPNAIPSVKESWASGYLRRRKEAQKEEESQQNEKPMGVFALKPKEVTKICTKEAPPTESVSAQQAFMARLMAAHSVVDDLLSKRGLKGEDENKFLKHYEWVPVIEEELPEQRLSPRAIRRRRMTVSPRRSVSSESDSGLSMESTTSEPIEQRFEEIDAQNCEFRQDSLESEGCEICVLMSGTDIEVSFDVKKPEKKRKSKSKSPIKEKTPEVVKQPIKEKTPEVVKPESKSTKKLVRQKLNVEEVEELHVKLPEKAQPKSTKKLVRQNISTNEVEELHFKLAEPKSTKKLVRQNISINEVEELRFKLPQKSKVEEDVPLQIAFSKCAISKCKVNKIEEPVNERVKLKPISVEPKPESKSATKMVNSNISSNKVEELRAKLPEKSKIKVEEELPLQLAFSKCAISKCKVNKIEETVNERVKLKPINVKPKEEEKPATKPFDEVALKKVVKIQEATKEKSPEQKIGKLKKLEPKPETPNEAPKRTINKLLKRQQTEPTLPSPQRQVGKLQLNDNKSSPVDPNTNKLLSRPSRHLLDSLSLMTMANRTTNARFKAQFDPSQVGKADISIQHCSFYEVKKALSEPKEKCLRIHLRLTARPTATALSVQKVWPTNERTHRLVHHIVERRDIVALTNELKQEEKKLPGKLKIETPKFMELPPCRPLIFTDTSVKQVKEKLKRQQANAELQSLRGNLKRVPKKRIVSLSKPDESLSNKKPINLDGAKMKTKQRKIVKKIVKKTKKNEEKQEIAQTSSNSSLQNKFITSSSSSLQIPEDSIHQSLSSSSIASSNKSTSSRKLPTVMNKKFMTNWERRIIEEFRRHLNIPVLNAIYRQIFCLKCKICPMLGAPRPPPRANFVKRQTPHHKPHLSDLSGTDLLRLMAIFRPSAGQIARTSTKSHRPRSNEDNPFGVSLRHVNRRQRRPWIPLNQRKPKFQYVPQWRQQEQ